MKILDAYSDVIWEQRRYEIAKDILATSHIAQQIGQYSYHEETEVKDAVRMADLLIAELKKKPKEDVEPRELRTQVVDCYKCSECGRQLMFSKGISHIVCPACGSENLERTTMGEMLNKTITVNLEDEDK